MPAADAGRQGDITGLAFQVLGKEAAIAFLNTQNPELGGRPIAIATQSDSGSAAVRAELAKLTANRPSD